MAVVHLDGNQCLTVGEAYRLDCVNLPKSLCNVSDYR